MERRPQPHCVDDEPALVGEREDDHFEEPAIATRADHQQLGRVSIGVHVHDNQRVLDGMDDLLGIDAVSIR